jgi:hypothetical protein
LGYVLRLWNFAYRGESHIKMKAIYCKCHKTHVEHWAKKIELHGIRKPSSPVCTKEQFRCLSKVDDVVVWFAKVYFFFAVVDFIGPKRGPQETLQELGPCHDHKHPLHDLSSNNVALRDEQWTVTISVISDTKHCCHYKD